MLAGMEKKSTIVEEEEEGDTDETMPTGKVQFSGLPSRFTEVQLSQLDGE